MTGGWDLGKGAKAGLSSPPTHHTPARSHTHTHRNLLRGLNPLSFHSPHDWGVGPRQRCEGSSIHALLFPPASSTHPTRSSTHSLTHLSSNSSIHPFTHPCIHPSTISYISHIHPFIHSDRQPAQEAHPRAGLRLRGRRLLRPRGAIRGRGGWWMWGKGGGCGGWVVVVRVGWWLCGKGGG